jgi:Effector-associated domain 7
MQSRSVSPSPAAALRQLMNTSFNLDEIKALSFDLGVDFDSLSGDDKGSKIIELIQHCGRAGTVAALVDQCRKLRPTPAWDTIGIAAAENPAQFSFVPGLSDTARPVLNVSPDRAAKLGFAAGFVVLFIFICGFSGGILASDLVDITINPVQANEKRLQEAPILVGGRTTTAERLGEKHLSVLQNASSGALPAGTELTLQYDNVQATTLVQNVLSAARDTPVSDFHARFTANGEGTANFVLGGRRFVVAYTARAEGGAIYITPTRVIVQLIKTDSSFGWVSVPAAFVQPFTNWAQAQLNVVSKTLAFRRVVIRDNALRIDFVAR